MAKYGMVINLALCMRCSACMVACKMEHQIPTGKHAGLALLILEHAYPIVPHS